MASVSVSVSAAATASSSSSSSLSARPAHHYAHSRPRPSSISGSSTDTNGGPPLIQVTPASVPASVAAPPLAPFTRSFTVPAPPPRSSRLSSSTASGLKSFMSSSSSRGSSPSHLSSSSSSSRRHSLPGVESGNATQCPRWARVVAAARAISANVDATNFSISNTLADVQSPTTQSQLARSSSSPSPTASSASARSSAAAARLSATSRMLSRLIHDLRLEVDDDLVQLDRAIIDLVYHARKLVLSGTVPGVVPMATLLDTLWACERGVGSVARAAGELCAKLQATCVDAMTLAAEGVDGVNVQQVFDDMHIARAHFVSQLELADATRPAPPSTQVPMELVNIVQLQAQIRDEALTLNRLDQAVKRAPGLICQGMLPTGSTSTPSPTLGTKERGLLHRSASFSSLVPLPSSSQTHRPGSILSTFSSMFTSSSAHSSRSASPSPRSMSSPHRLSISSTVSSDSTLLADEDQMQSPTAADAPPVTCPPAKSTNTSTNMSSSVHDRCLRFAKAIPDRQARLGNGNGP
ncbi:hypothetical protein BCR44DRAFT_1494933 [Catenaria anguillulae PL171]|uniref:Uncharacterized protein n=1 Tax=Catenaria anguillulae PL171 TaxID=765915 RepID=A0A1Y2I534_9FUNG|nr:hypothetical protein BCR44DRAFT_1494933 [Catenaria anguillulae PL171]